MTRMPTGGQTRGAQPKPTALKILHGDEIAKQKLLGEPKPSANPVQPPQFLTKPGRKLWDELTPDMIRVGLLTSWDAPIFGEFCEALVLARVARIQAMREASGQVMVSQGQASATTGWLKAMTIVSTLSQRFGMTPGDRTRIVANAMAGIDQPYQNGNDLLSG